MNFYGEISLQALHFPSKLFFLEDKPGCFSVSKWYRLPVYLCVEGCRCKDRAMRNPLWEVLHEQ